MELYCVECEETVWADLGLHGYSHTVWTWNMGFGIDRLDVHRLFTTSAPPELPENWEDFVSEPDPEELEMMDRAAESLVLELAS